MLWIPIHFNLDLIPRARILITTVQIFVSSKISIHFFIAFYEIVMKIQEKPRNSKIILFLIFFFS